MTGSPLVSLTLAFTALYIGMFAVNPDHEEVLIPPFVG